MIRQRGLETMPPAELARLQSGRLEEALAHFSEAIRLSPDYAKAQHNKELVLQEMEERE